MIFCPFRIFPHTQFNFFCVVHLRLYLLFFFSLPFSPFTFHFFVLYVFFSPKCFLIFSYV